ncbi:MAG: FecR domain-containing protein [Alphaproteobacteria bacterium]|nr:FecR domain-containing protein [Alphaproteobacteria bacterium]MBV9150902.1 FecR domain-containing protein [Alphaproteobacteria bacterium]
MGVSAAVPFSRLAITAESVAGYVAEVRGEVTAELAASRRVLVPRDTIFIGDDVLSGSQSRAALQLGRDTSLRLGANAQVRIDRFIVDAGGVLTLEGGPLLLNKAPGSAGMLQIRGSFGLITVRGTGVFVGPSNGVIGIFVVHGEIYVLSGGRSVVLNTGEGTDISAPGAPPTPPARWGAARISAAYASVT